MVGETAVVMEAPMARTTRADSSPDSASVGAILCEAKKTIAFPQSFLRGDDILMEQYPEHARWGVLRPRGRG
jgi:hypothetical protein